VKLKLWPGVRRAGAPSAEPGADAGRPAQRDALITERLNSAAVGTRGELSLCSEQICLLWPGATLPVEAVLGHVLGAQNDQVRTLATLCKLGPDAAQIGGSAREHESS
jgi:hypothetical protein